MSIASITVEKSVQSFTITPRASEINGGGHVGNAVVPIWFEEARLPILNAALQHMAPTDTHMVRHAAYSYERELLYKGAVEIRTTVEKIGTTSAVLHQEAWQNGERAVSATTTVVFFSRAAHSKIAIADAARAFLEVLR